MKKILKTIKNYNFKTNNKNCYIYYINTIGFSFFSFKKLVILSFNKS